MRRNSAVSSRCAQGEAAAATRVSCGFRGQGSGGEGREQRRTCLLLPLLGLRLVAHGVAKEVLLVQLAQTLLAALLGHFGGLVLGHDGGRRRRIARLHVIKRLVQDPLLDRVLQRRRALHRHLRRAPSRHVVLQVGLQQTEEEEEREGRGGAGELLSWGRGVGRRCRPKARLWAALAPVLRALPCAGLTLQVPLLCGYQLALQGLDALPELLLLLLVRG